MLRAILVAVLGISCAWAADFAPVAPIEVLNKPLSALEKTKGKGEYTYGVSAEGKSLADVDYSETWFGLPDPVKAHYIVSTAKEADPKIIQITLGFKNDVKRDAIIKAASTFLGKAAEGKSEEGAPSEYYAQWVKDRVRYDLQDFGDYKEMYISLALFSYSDKFKIKDPVAIIEQQIGTVRAHHGPEKIWLLQSMGEDERVFGDAFLYVASVGKEDDGNLIAIPRLLEQLFTCSIHLGDFTGDHIDDVLVTLRTSEFRGASAGTLLDISKGNARIIFNSNDWCHLHAEFHDAGKATVTIYKNSDYKEISAQGIEIDVREWPEKFSQDGKLLAPFSVTGAGIDGVEPLEAKDGRPARLACKIPYWIYDKSPSMSVFFSLNFSYREGKMALNDVRVVDIPPPTPATSN